MEHTERVKLTFSPLPLTFCSSLMVFYVLHTSRNMAFHLQVEHLLSQHRGLIRPCDLIFDLKPAPSVTRDMGHLIMNFALSKTYSCYFRSRHRKDGPHNKHNYGNYNNALGAYVEWILFTKTHELLGCNALLRSTLV